jgi:hypothetical protein
MSDFGEIARLGTSCKNTGGFVRLTIPWAPQAASCQGASWLAGSRRRHNLVWGWGDGLRPGGRPKFLSLTNLVERVPSSFWFDYEIHAGAVPLHLASGESMARKVLPFAAHFAQMPATTSAGSAGGTHAIMDLTGHTPFGFP